MPATDEAGTKPAAEKHVSNLVNNLPVDDEPTDSEKHVSNLVNNLPTDEDGPSLSEAVYGSSSGDDQSGSGQSTDDHLSDAYEDANDLSGGKLDEYKDQQIDKLKDNLGLGKSKTGDVAEKAGEGAVNAGEKAGELAAEAAPEAAGVAGAEAGAVGGGATGAAAGGAAGTAGGAAAGGAAGAAGGAAAGGAAGAGAGAAGGAGAGAGTGAAIGAIAAGVPTAGIGAPIGAAAGAGAGAGTGAAAGAAGGAAVGATGGAAAGGAAGAGAGGAAGGAAGAGAGGAEGAAAGGAVAGEAASQGAKAGGKTLSNSSEFMKGLDKVSEKMEEAQNVKKKLEKADKRTRKIMKCCGCCLLPFILIAVVAGISIQGLFQLDSTDKIKDKINEVMNKDYPSTKLNFTDPASEEAIKNNDVGTNTFQTMVSLTSHFKGNAEIHYKGSPSAATGRENQPYEFDLLSADLIKCTDIVNNKKIEPPIKISLDSSKDWAALSTPETKDYLCAMGYYPNLESPLDSPSPANPGQFLLSDIATSGPIAAQSKIYESVETALKDNADLVRNSGGFPITKVLVPSKYFDSVMENGQSLGSALKSKAKEIFPDRNADEIIRRDTNTKGVHIGFD